MEELIARGGTFGLILALVLAVSFLVRLALKYNDQIITELKTQIERVVEDRDQWRDKAERALTGFDEATSAVSELASAINKRNQIEQELLADARLREEIRAQVIREAEEP